MPSNVSKYQQKAFAFKGRPEDGFCIKVSSYQYKGFHNKDNTVWWQSYSYSGIYLSGTNIYIEMDPLRISEIHWITDASRDRRIGPCHGNTYTWNNCIYIETGSCLPGLGIRGCLYTIFVICLKILTEVFPQGWNQRRKQHWFRWWLGAGHATGIYLNQR